MYYSGRCVLLLAIAVLLLYGTAVAQMDFYNKQFLHAKDSLLKELNKHPLPDTVRAAALMHVLDCAAFLSQKKQLLPWWEEAVQLSRKIKDKKTEVGCLVWKGSYYKSAQKNDSAILYLDSAIQLTGNATDPWMKKVKGFAQFEKSLLYEYQENFYTALSNYFESLKTYNGSDLNRQKMICLRIATIYEKLHNDEKALEYYQAALKLYKEAKGKMANNEAEGIYTYIAGIYFNRGELVKARFYLDKMKPAMPDTVETTVTASYYHLAGQIALREKKNDSSIALLKEALKYYGYTGQMHADGTANVCADIARLQMENKNMAEAKKYAEQSITAAKQSSHKQTMTGSLTVLAAYYNKTGSQSAAYHALHEASVLNDSLLNETNIKQANTLAAIYENDKKEKAIAQLETDKRIQLAEVKQKSLLNTIFIITIGALLIISTISYFNFKNKQKIEQQKIAQLEKEKQLMGIEAMLKGQEEERSRLARDLHDGLGGMLSGVKISFSNMKENLIMDDENAKTFEKSIRQLDETIAELRKVAHNLMPEALVKFGLASAVTDFCASMQLSGTTRIICEQFGSERELGNIADVNIYRIIQELVNNAIVHGKASQVVVQLTKAPAKVLITVEDNGKGFDPRLTEKPRGIGLSNIKSRVNYFNGKTDLSSKPGEGTTFNIELMA